MLFKVPHGQKNLIIISTLKIIKLSKKKFLNNNILKVGQLILIKNFEINLAEIFIKILSCLEFCVKNQTIFSQKI